VVIRKQEQADNGDRVVAMIDKAMTLKKFYRRKDHIKLEPANGTMEPIIVDPTRQDVSILGKLIGVIRRCD
jgi:repressor LexA